MKSNSLTRILRITLCALVLTVALPVVAFGQRWVIVRPRTRSRVMVYQPRSDVIYQRRSYVYRSNVYSDPRYSGYYSYRYSQPYFANRYTYSYVNPSYRYYEYGYQPRPRQNRLRVGAWWR